MIRTILIALFLIIFFILGIPIGAVEWIVKKYNPKAADISCLRIVQFAFKIICVICGVKLTVIGEENVPKDEPVLYVGNHRSYFDVVITYARCPRLTGYVAKDSIENIPFLSKWMKRLHCLFLNRDNAKEGLKTILVGINQIKNGISMCIFPEGTRGTGKDEFDMLPFKEGSMKMAEKTGCAIIPMALTNTADIFEKHMPWMKPAHVILQYGAPIYPKQLDKDTQKRLGAYTQEQIRSMLIENQKHL